MKVSDTHFAVPRKQKGKNFVATGFGHLSDDQLSYVLTIFEWKGRESDGDALLIKLNASRTFSQAWCRWHSKCAAVKRLQRVRANQLIRDPFLAWKGVVSQK